MPDFDLAQLCHSVVDSDDLCLEEFTCSVMPAWEESIEAQMGFAPELCQKLRELHEFSKSATRKQTRNHSKKMAKKMAAARTAPQFSMQRDVLLKFD